MYRIIKAVTVRNDDLALAIMFSLAGLDLSLWLAAKSIALPAGGFAAALAGLS